MNAFEFGPHSRNRKEKEYNYTANTFQIVKFN